MPIQAQTAGQHQLCGASPHMRVHEGGWHLVRTDEGRLLTVPPPVHWSPRAVLVQRARGPGLVAAA